MIERTTRWTVFVLTAVGLLVTACNGSGAEPQMQDPFSARSVGEDGIVVEWSGYTEGYRANPGPSKRYSIDLSFRNERDTKWQVRYCIFLLDGQEVVADLGRRDLALDPGAGVDTPHILGLPSDLEKGAYGLALVVHKPEGPIVNTVTIRAGDTTEIYDSQGSAYQSALDACPAPSATNFSTLWTLAWREWITTMPVADQPLAA
jgi:hypothetical protein